MKTKEFIKKVEELGFRTTHINGYMYIENRMCDTCAIVNKYNCYEFNTDMKDFYELKEETKKQLFELLVEYSHTPIEKRKEEKKYYLKHKFLTNGNSERYLNYIFNCSEWILDDNTMCDDFKTQFTEQEIEEIKQKFNTNLNDFEMIEAKGE